MDKWDHRFMDLANVVASWSKDPSTQVGAVIVSLCRRKISVGYNGLPRPMKDTPEILENRGAKYSKILHAEVNAILNAQFSLDDCVLYSTCPPCQPCASMIMQAGIVRVVTSAIVPGRWADQQTIARANLLECGVTYVEAWP